jgi:hypothetical protein
MEKKLPVTSSREVILSSYYERVDTHQFSDRKERTDVPRAFYNTKTVGIMGFKSSYESIITHMSPYLIVYEWSMSIWQELQTACRSSD